MASKTPKQIKKQLEQFYKMRAEALRRNPEFIKDYEQWVKFDRQQNLGPGPKSHEERQRIATESFMMRLNIYEKYQISSIIDPNNPNFRAEYPSPACYVSSKKESYSEFIRKQMGGDYVKASERLLELIEKKPGDYIQYMLRDNRFLNIQVDMYRDTEIIIHRVKEMIKEMKEDMKKYSLLKRFDKSPNLDKFPRYFAVWDLVQKRQQLWPFERIAQKLKEENWYKKQTLEQATVLARQDYRIACKWIGIPVKINKGALRKISKPIIKLKEGKKYAEEFVKWEKILTEKGLGLDEFIKEGSCEDKDKHVSNPAGGPTKQKLQKDLKINEQVRNRADAKRKSIIWESFK